MATALRWHWSRPIASLQERTGTYRVIFRFHGKQYFVMIGKVSPEEAEAKAAQVDYLLMRIKQGLIELPPGVDIAEFVQHDGKPPAPATPASASRKTLTLEVLRDRYLDTRAAGREKSTLYTDGIHFKHLIATLGEKFPLEGLVQADLQRHIERRAKLSISATTIRKEITTFGPPGIGRSMLACIQAIIRTRGWSISRPMNFRPTRPAKRWSGKQLGRA